MQTNAHRFIQMLVNIAIKVWSNKSSHLKSYTRFCHLHRFFVHCGNHYMSGTFFWPGAFADLTNYKKNASGRFDSIQDPHIWPCLASSQRWRSVAWARVYAPSMPSTTLALRDVGVAMSIDAHALTAIYHLHLYDKIGASASTRLR